MRMMKKYFSGVLSPSGLVVIEIKITGYSNSGIKALLDSYSPKRSNIQKYCSIFDNKELITKQDIESKIWTKVPTQDVRSLALDAVKLAQTKKIDREEIKEASQKSGKASGKRHSRPDSLEARLII